jgi:hypothetical protein
MMDNHPTAQMLWQITTATVERHMTVGANGLSMSLRTQEVTMSAAVDAPATHGAERCADLELGAHVARMRIWPTSPAPSPRRSPTPAELTRWIPEVLEPA